MRDSMQILQNFRVDDLPNLDTVVLAALELFSSNSTPEIDTSIYKHPLVVGSGNAEATGKILFETADAIFASESNFEQKLQANPHIDGVVLISASGSKHAPIIAKRSKELGRHVTLITNTPNSQAAIELDTEHDDEQFVFPKNREPYTYNTSTYMGMILGATKEDPAMIMKFINETFATVQLPDFTAYDKYYLIVPAKFSGIIRMLQVKFIELFGRNIARDIETDEYVAHATTVAPSNELFISFGNKNTQWGSTENRLHIPLPDNADYAAMMAVSYYLVGQIQKAYPSYFKDNIVQYTAEVSEIFGAEILPIVE